jgi:uncharacterized protein
MVTNGYALLPDVTFELEVSHSVTFFEVTLDGTRDTHDARRGLKSGKGSFDRILSNLVGIAKRPDIRAGIRIRCNVDRRNGVDVIPLIHLLAEKGLAERVAFYCAPIHSWGNDAHDLAYPADVYAELEIEWLAEAINSGFTVPLIPPRKEINCLAVRRTGDVISATGELFNCTEVPYVPAYAKTNEYLIGHLDTGEEPGRRNLLADFNDRVERGDFGCSSCRMLPVCGGSCPKLWQEGIAPCPSAKQNIEKRLLLHLAQSNIAAGRS